MASPSRPRLAAVMFDLDGTLVDTMGAFADLAAEVMATRHGYDRVRARERYLETSGIPFHQQLEVIVPADARNGAASAEFEERKRAVCDATMMDAATLEGLAALRALGFKLVVSSNTGQEFVDDFARREPFTFDLALGFDATRGLAKGRPHVEHTIAMLGLEREQLVFCGDSLKDAELAEQCGIAFVGRLGTFTLADFRARDPEAIAVGNVVELPALLRARMAA
ncbi:MAG TPA: HAD hydrolase-like protein [Kofleriaceae bacterium]|nr:HAD hydrolase-like protein [Kofleriaceae bacterium]